MVKLLVKKQLRELFRSYFFNQKKNTKRSVAGTVLYFIFFAVIMVGVLGGMFTALSITLCAPLAGVNMGWLYFAIMIVLAVVLGVFGSVFNSYSGLYLAKDNDLLLSLPIPPRALIVSRLLTVYLMGLMYSACVAVPTVIVWWCVAPISVGSIVGGILLVFLISVFVLLLSCLLGWVVAKVSLRMKNRSFAVVFLSLLFIGLYYFFYFKAQSLIRDLIANAAAYGAAVKSSAYPIYLVGRVGEGDWFAILVVTAVVLVLALLTWRILSRSFLGIATATGAVTKTVYKDRAVKARSVFRALLSKEYRRFISNPNYMLNCGLGVLLIPVSAILLLWRGGELAELLGEVFQGLPGAVAALLCSAMCMLASMNNMATPSVSLEGKNIWLMQSLPVSPWEPLKAKLSLQILLTAIPLLFCGVCGAIAIHATAVETVLLLLIPVLYSILTASLGLMLGTVRADLHWTNEIAPIKQSMSVMFVLLIGWVLALVPGGGYLLLADRISLPLYLALLAVVFAALCALLIFWLRKNGARRFAALS